MHKTTILTYTDSYRKNCAKTATLKKTQKLVFITNYRLMQVKDTEKMYLKLVIHIKSHLNKADSCGFLTQDNALPTLMQC